MARLLGIDVGERKIGLAVADSGSGFSFARAPLLVHDWSAAWPVLRRLVTDEQIDRIVVGWPLGTRGQAGQQAARVETFIGELSRHVTIPVERLDERFTTQAVQRRADRGKLRRGAEDSLAAQALLETYLAKESRS